MPSSTAIWSRPVPRAPRQPQDHRRGRGAGAGDGGRRDRCRGPDRPAARGGRRRRLRAVRHLRAGRPGRAEPPAGDEPGGHCAPARSPTSPPCAPTALRAGIRLHAWPVDPRPEPEVPLQLTSPRYVAMQRHFDTVGPAGRVMMRRTASTQVCLDWWPGARRRSSSGGSSTWPARSWPRPSPAAPGPGSRLATWLAVDPARTAFDGRLLRATTRSRRTPRSPPARRRSSPRVPTT